MSPTLAAWSSRSTSSMLIALGNLAGGRGGLTAPAASVSTSPSRARNRWKPRTATSVRAADDAASGGCSALPSRSVARKSLTCASVMPVGSVTPFEARYAA